MCGVYGEAGFSKKNVNKWAIYSLRLRAWVENYVHEVEHIDSLEKEKFPGNMVREEGHADNVLEHEWNHHNWFPWKSCNNKQYAQLAISLAKFIFLYWKSLVYI